MFTARRVNKPNIRVSIQLSASQPGRRGKDRLSLRMATLPRLRIHEYYCYFQSLHFLECMNHKNAWLPNSFYWIQSTALSYYSVRSQSWHIVPLVGIVRKINMLVLVQKYSNGEILNVTRKEEEDEEEKIKTLAYANECLWSVMQYMNVE